MPNRKIQPDFSISSGNGRKRTHQGTPYSERDSSPPPPSTPFTDSRAHMSQLLIKQPSKNQHHIVVKGELAVSSSTKKLKTRTLPNNTDMIKKYKSTYSL
ncbi:hypothetical protein GDO78_010414 [Eleutherodactylus coqui]|uniref:Uncharacterized protein n=1 Tax=Eleutherodactylus coqui TaxID=57060 RepID=A0A8J6K6N4_ELECQ|nr:hypothetical protein GDO78_010414 [Eleutherodactylus coqui]